MIGVRGSRVQSVSSELKGEKIDIIRYSDDLAEFVINALSPARVERVTIDEENEVIEVVVNEDQLKLAIGRAGQNVKLASRIVNHRINIITDSEENEKRKNEFNNNSNILVEALDVDDIIANLLVAEGFLSVEDVVNADIKKIANIEGFDSDIALEIKERAMESLKNKGADTSS